MTQGAELDYIDAYRARLKSAPAREIASQAGAGMYGDERHFAIATAQAERASDKADHT